MKNYDEQDWNYLLHCGIFKTLLLEGKINESSISDYIDIWKRQKSWHGINQFLGIDGEQFIHLIYHPDKIKEVLSIDDREELIRKFPAYGKEKHAEWMNKCCGFRRNQYVCKKCGCHFKKINGEYICWNCGMKKITKKEWNAVE